ncbi:hypothetical protein [Achromobacter sp. AGC39]
MTQDELQAAHKAMTDRLLPYLRPNLGAEDQERWESITEDIAQFLNESGYVLQRGDMVCWEHGTLIGDPSLELTVRTDLGLSESAWESLAEADKARHQTNWIYGAAGA